MNMRSTHRGRVHTTIDANIFILITLLSALLFDYYEHQSTTQNYQDVSQRITMTLLASMHYSFSQF
jgi:hypothetical protein